MNSILRWTIRALGGSRSPLVRVKPPLISSETKVEEERLLGYDPKNYYPAQLGQILHDRYQILIKLGFGAHSTVWLAQDLLRWKTFVAIKILTVEQSQESKKPHELNIFKHIAVAEKTYGRCEYLRGLSDFFVIPGHNGHHTCLIHTPLRESASILQNRFLQGTFGKTPDGFVKQIMLCVLLALDHLHSNCNIVHTDIRAENIMYKIKHQPDIDELLKAEEEDPSPQRDLGDRTIYTSRPFQNVKCLGIPILADFGHALVMEQKGFKQNAQPDAYRAPEVLLSAQWGYSVDIWNLVCLVWEMYEGEDLFNVNHPKTGEYDHFIHAAAIQAKIGPPPMDYAVRCPAAKGFFGNDGMLMRLHELNLVDNTSLENSEVRLQGKEQELFLDLMRSMLRWVPEERKTPKQLLYHPWLAPSTSDDQH